VDSGGKGLIYFMQGALGGISYEGEPVVEVSGASSSDNETHSGANFASISPADIKLVYCTEFLIEINMSAFSSAEAIAAATENLTEYLMSQGDSVVVVNDEDVIKVHVHTNHPGKVLEKALTIGPITNIKIENMRSQHTEMAGFSEAAPVIAQGEPKEIGFAAVAAGEGFSELFKDLGVDVVIEGGQTMNPSAEDIANAVQRVNAKNVIVLPNNKNIILAAEQAAHLISTDQKIHVIPTKFVPQGVACVLNYMDTDSAEENIVNMTEQIKNISTGQITFAVRDTVVNGQTIKEGNILCLYNGEIVLTTENVPEAGKQLLDYMLEKSGNTGDEFVSIYYGEDVSEEAAEELAAYTASKGLEAELYDGKQPLYYYILSVE
jgi:DAK2 domain fusion protein YloV